MANVSRKPVTEARRQPASSPEEPPRLRTVFEEHGAFVCRSLRLLGVPEADLDDVLQEVFLVVHQRLHDYEERGRARAWLYSICTRLARAQRRKLWRRREEMSAELPDAPSDATQLQRIADNEALALGHELLRRLPREQQDVFWLYEVEELPMSEIAEALGCPLQTAYSRLYKARQRIVAEAELWHQGERSKDTDHE
jgi:RNA polymerase sigma-70 factor (ECF subfamily)